MAETAHAETAASNRRKHPRTSVLWPGQVSKPDGRADCLVFNLSAGGAKLRVTEPVQLNTDLTLRIAQFGDFCGTVVWTAKNLVGVRFSTAAAEVAARLGAALPLCSREPA